MDKEDKKIEQYLKNLISGVTPTHSSFNTVLKSVTNNKYVRNKDEKDYYKLIHLGMSKFLKIGIPIAVVAVVVVVGMSTPKDILITDTVSVENLNDGPVVNNQESNEDEAASADDILASFFVDADNDAVFANRESEDESYMNSQIDAFNSFNQTNYETNI